MEKAIIATIMGILLVSLATASLVPFLSNQIEGEIKIWGLVFYTGPAESLILNDNSHTSSTKTIDGLESFNFIMTPDNSFDGLDFYKTNLNFILDIEMENLTDIPRPIKLDFGYIKKSGSSKIICETIFLQVQGDNNYTIPCNSNNDIPINVDRFYFSIKGQADDYISYKIKTKYTYVEMIGK